MDRRGPVLNTRQAAQYVASTPGNLRRLKHLGTGPVAHKQGRLNVYYPADLDEWLATRDEAPTVPAVASPVDLRAPRSQRAVAVESPPATPATADQH